MTGWFRWLATVYLQRTGSNCPYGDGQRRNRASLEWNGAFTRLRMSDVSPLFFSLSQYTRKLSSRTVGSRWRPRTRFSCYRGIDDTSLTSVTVHLNIVVFVFTFVITLHIAFDSAWRKERKIRRTVLCAPFSAFGW